MAFHSPTPSQLISVLVVISAVSATARELRPSDHGLEYQGDPSLPISNPKPPPSMLSFFGASTFLPSPENAGGGIPKEADSSDLSMNDSPKKHDHAEGILLVASLACGAAGVALLMASGLLFLFKYKKDQIGSGNARSLAVKPPMLQLPPPTAKVIQQVPLEI